MIDYINTNTFRDFSDFIVNYSDGKYFTNEILKKNAIIWCNTTVLDDLFKQLAFAGRKYVLITHASDYAITKEKFNKRPACIKKWFAENKDYVHPDLFGIPIGLTPNKDSDKTYLDLEWFLENLERLKAKEKNKEILYCNWYTPNNPAKRENILNKLNAANIKYIWDKPKFPSNINELVNEQKNLLKQGKTNCKRFNELLNYYNYCENMAQYQFVVSPPGNGMDCHRTWEALYMGCFPIVLKHSMYDEYKELPIIQVNDYSEITYDLLYSYLNKKYSYEKLNMSYWKTKILEEFKKL